MPRVGLVGLLSFRKIQRNVVRFLIVGPRIIDPRKPKGFKLPQIERIREQLLFSKI